MRREIIYDILRFALSDDKANFGVFNDVSEEEWKWVFEVMSMHGVAPLVGNALERMPENVRPPKDVLLKFISSSVAGQRSYVRLTTLAEKIDSVIKDGGIKCLLLKGLSLAEYYPRPELRKFLDMDLYAPDASHMVDEIFVAKGMKVDTDFYRHSHMTLGGVLVENHHFLLDVRGRKKMEKLDADLMVMAMEHLAEYEGPGLYYPDARFSLIFNLHHAMSHFIYEGISFKFLVDWILFLRREKQYLVDNQSILGSDLRKHGLMKFAAVMSDVSVKYLGLSIDDVPECIEVEMTGLNPKVVERFVNDLFRPYEPSHMKGLLVERVNNVRRIINASWKPKVFLGQSAFGFVFDKFIPILLGRKFEAD